MPVRTGAMLIVAGDSVRRAGRLRRAAQQGLSSASQPSRNTVRATTPTTTIVAAQHRAGQPAADGRAELAADDRADADQRHDLPVDVGHDREQQPGDAR